MQKPALVRSLALIGAGQMGLALLKGWQAKAKSLPLALQVVEPNPSPALATLLAKSGWHLVDQANGACDVLVLAIKPQMFAQIAPALRACIGPQTLVLSILAGTTLSTMSRALDTERVVRAMPNTPGSIGKGITAFAAARGLEAADLALTTQLLAPFGKVEALSDERQLDAVTALSGSGPAYVFHLCEAMAAAGEAEGLEPELALRLARATIAGAGAMLMEEQLSPAQLRKNVTSPGGTTQAALDVLMSGGAMAMLLRKAIMAAAHRSRELGKPS